MISYMIAENLKKMGITLPNPPSPAGAYVPVTIANGIAFVSGQIPYQGVMARYSILAKSGIQISLMQKNRI